MTIKEILYDVRSHYNNKDFLIPQGEYVKMEKVSFLIEDMLIEEDPITDFIKSEQGRGLAPFAVYSKIPLRLWNTHKVSEVRKRINLKTGMEVDFELENLCEHKWYTTDLRVH